MAFSAGDVVLVPFPYRDRLAERARPSVVVSADTYNQHGDVVVAAITSRAPRVAMDFALGDFSKRISLFSQNVEAGLIKISYLGNSGWRSNRASTACIAALPSEMPLW
jgi:PemK-like, MazF-like toxin of type II toxin-antitoxin system